MQVTAATATRGSAGLSDPELDQHHEVGVEQAPQDRELLPHPGQVDVVDLDPSDEPRRPGPVVDLVDHGVDVEALRVPARRGRGS